VSRRTTSLPAGYFEAIYQRDADPWGFASSDYEREKYAATLQALPRVSYRHGLEIGCSIGVLTSQLAARCERLLAIDAVEAALNQARERCGGDPGVTFQRMEVPSRLPDGSFDLLVLSEVAYYWDVGDLMLMAGFAEGAIEAGGDIILVHWTGETDYPLTGDEAAQRFIAAVAPSTQVVHQSRAELYRLDVLRRLGQQPAP
jgi:predicted TPR repeat methyltransferase